MYKMSNSPTDTPATVHHAALQAGLAARAAPGSSSGGDSEAAAAEVVCPVPEPDSMARTTAKALGWRAFSTVATFIFLALVLGDEVEQSQILTIGGIDVVGKTILYIIYERAWVTWFSNTDPK